MQSCKAAHTLPAVSGSFSSLDNETSRYWKWKFPIYHEIILVPDVYPGLLGRRLYGWGATELPSASGNARHERMPLKRRDVPAAHENWLLRFLNLYRYTHNPLCLYTSHGAAVSRSGLFRRKTRDDFRNRYAAIFF